MSGLRVYALGFVGFLRYGLLSLLEDVPRHAGLRFVTTVGGSCATCGELRAVGSAGSEDASVAWMPKWLWEKMVARMRAVGRYDSGRVRERLRGPQGRANQLLLAA